MKKPTNSEIAAFKDSIQGVVRALSEKHVKVTQMGVKASVDYDSRGNVRSVNIPVLSDGADLDLMNSIRGFIDHEVAGILFSDSLFRPENSMRHETGDVKKSATGIYDIIEGYRVDREMIKRFPGSAKNIGHVEKRVINGAIRDSISEAVDSGNISELVNSVLTPYLRAKMGDSNSELLLKEFPLGEVTAFLDEKIGSLVDRVPVSSKEVLKLTRSILDAFKHEETPPESADSSDSDESDTADSSSDKTSEDEKPSETGKTESPDSIEDKPESDKSDESEHDSEKPDEEEDEKSEGDDKDGEGESSEGDKDGEKSEGDESDGRKEAERHESDESSGEEMGGKPDSDGSGAESGDVEGASESSFGEPSDSTGSSGDGEEVDGEAEIFEVGYDTETVDGSSSSEKSPISFSVKDIDPESISEIASEMISEGASKAAKGHYLPYTTDNDKVIKVEGSGERFHLFKSTVEGMRRGVMSMTTKMRRILAAQSLSVQYGGYRSGKLQSSAAYRICIGDDRVFSRKVEHQSEETAVSLLLDMSGSMRGRRIKTACESAVMFGEALSKLGVNFEIIGFTAEREYSRDFTPEMQKEFRKRSGLFSRFIPLRTYVFKEFSQKYSNGVKEALFEVGNRLSPINLVQNVDGESVQIALGRLSTQLQPRKILIVLSDGCPASDTEDMEVLSDHLKDVVKNAEKEGFEIVGIGIQTQAVKRFYSKSVVVNDVSELPGEVMNQLQKVILGRK